MAQRITKATVKSMFVLNLWHYPEYGQMTVVSFDTAKEMGDYIDKVCDDLDGRYPEKRPHVTYEYAICSSVQFETVHSMHESSPI